MSGSRRLGLLLISPPGSTRARVGLALAHEALARGDEVLVYLLEEGVRLLDHEDAVGLGERGASLYCCALGARRRGIEPDRRAVFAGLYTLASMVAGCDRFLAL